MVLEEFERVILRVVPIWDRAGDGPGWVELERMALASPGFGVEVDWDIRVRN